MFEIFIAVFAALNLIFSGINIVADNKIKVILNLIVGSVLLATLGGWL